MATKVFLFTDIEGSSRLWEDHEAAMRHALAAHDALLAAAFADHGGQVFATMGDGMAAAFDSAADALGAAARIQTGLWELSYDEIGRLRVRVGVHAGEAEARDRDFFGPVVNRTARLMAAGHGGQVLVSGVAAQLAGPDPFRFLDLGEHRLRDLGRPEQIHQLVVDGLPSEFPPLRTLTESANNLPLTLSSFVGREAELDAVIERARSNRLVTVTGVGGVGKTRLALQAAAELAPGFPHGTWFVPLAAVTDPDEIAVAFLEALSIQGEDADPRQAVVAHLTGRSALLVIDNCEHLVEASADLIGEILGRSPEVRAIVTSRELLGVDGEVAYGLRSMTMPSDASDPAWAEADAIHLLVDRARQADAAFDPTGREPALTEICRRLDGIPLAIELAAARLRTFSPERVAGLLDEGFRLLTGSARTAVPRQRTLEATIEWSHRLLDADEQAVFRRLAVFRGGFTLEAVQAVAGDDRLDDFTVLDLLANLVDKSLVSRLPEPNERFNLLETIRQFAAARLEAAGEGDDLRRRHALHFRDFLADATQRLRGSEGMIVRNEVVPERDNVRQALDWAIGADEGDLALELAAGFGRFSDEGHWTEPLHWYEAALEVAGEPPDHLAAATRLNTHAAFVGAGPDSDRSVSLAEEAIEILDRLDDGTDDPDRLLIHAMAVTNLAVMRFYRGEGGARNEHFRTQLERALELARRANHPRMVAVCLGNLAHHVDPEADPDEARALFARAEEAARLAGGEDAGLVWQRARFELHAGDLEGSRAAWERAIGLADDEGDQSQVLRLRIGLALTESELGDPTAPERIDRAIGDLVRRYETLDVGPATLQTVLLAAASAALQRGDLGRAARALGGSDAETGRGIPIPWDLARTARRIEALVDGGPGEAATEPARRAASTMSREQVVAFLVDGA